MLLPPLLLVDRVQLVPQQLVHGEHVNLLLLEDSLEFGVADDLTLVVGILKVLLLDVVPELLDHLRTRELIKLLTQNITSTFHLTSAYLSLASKLLQRIAQVKRLLEAATSLPLGLLAIAAGTSFTIVLVPHALGALLRLALLALVSGLAIGSLALSLVSTTGDALARQAVFLRLQLCGKAGVGVLDGRSLALPLLGGRLAVTVRRSRLGRACTVGLLRRRLLLDTRDGVEAGLDQLFDGILQGRLAHGKEWHFRGVKMKSACLLIAQVLANGLLQSLADLLTRNSLQVGLVEEIIDDARIALPLVFGYCDTPRRSAHQIKLTTSYDF